MVKDMKRALSDLIRLQLVVRLCVAIHPRSLVFRRSQEAAGNKWMGGTLRETAADGTGGKRSDMQEAAGWVERRHAGINVLYLCHIIHGSTNWKDEKVVIGMLQNGQPVGCTVHALLQTDLEGYGHSAFSLGIQTDQNRHFLCLKWGDRWRYS
jgi:hypothetical protein